MSFAGSPVSGGRTGRGGKGGNAPAAGGDEVTAAGAPATEPPPGSEAFCGCVKSVFAGTCTFPSGDTVPGSGGASSPGVFAGTGPIGDGTMGTGGGAACGGT